MLKIVFYAGLFICWGFLVFFPVQHVHASLKPGEILVVANKNASESVGLARYYMRERGVPEENLVQIWVTDRETVSRDDFERRIVPPVRRFLKEHEHGENIRCLLTMYGVPLRVGAAQVSEDAEHRLKQMQERRDLLQGLLEQVEGEEKEDIQGQLQDVRDRISQEKRERNTSASVDSELALILAGDYPLAMWVPNPHFVGTQGPRRAPGGPDRILMVSRLDGADSEIVKRIIHDSIQTEKVGLQGRAYFDARWPMSDERPQGGYGLYDYSLHQAALHLESNDIMPVIVEETSALFQPGDCPEAALYAGWYSLARYVPAFEWQPGSVGYHIASQECQSLRRGRYWCKRMLEEGVAATLGPVGEPYVQAFPPPEIFFALLTDGRLSLAEVYFYSIPSWSWKMVLVGDPLYRPFKNY